MKKFLEIKYNDDVVQYIIDNNEDPFERDRIEANIEKVKSFVSHHFISTEMEMQYCKIFLFLNDDTKFPDTIRFESYFFEDKEGMENNDIKRKVFGMITKYITNSVIITSGSS